MTLWYDKIIFHRIRCRICKMLCLW